MSRRVELREPGERVPAESHNALHLELRSADDRARAFVRQGMVLDIGCGAGYGSDLLAGRARLVIIDDEPAVDRVVAASCSHAPFDERVAAARV